VRSVRGREVSALRLEPHVREEGADLAGADEVTDELVVFRFVAELAGDDRGTDVEGGRERGDGLRGACGADAACQVINGYVTFYYAV
jgi:hypothetical protein